MRTFKQDCLREAFTRQHYEAIAKIIATHVKRADGQTLIVLNTIANDLADVFRDDNSRFDKGFFLNKCGV
jgi:hypothetical protein